VWLERGDDYPVCEREWNQVTAPGGDYDVDTAGFSGWLLQPEISGADVPFTHPFGRDWECMVALDKDYAGLLAAGNAVPDGIDATQAMEDAANLKICVPDGGLLAVETDGGCVPSALNARSATRCGSGTGSPCSAAGSSTPRTTWTCPARRATGRRCTRPC
jgi:hypothetical protein